MTRTPHPHAVTASGVAELLAMCERTEDTIHLSRSCVCRRYTLRGVPAKRIDVIIDHRLTDGGDIDPRDRIVVTRIDKPGRYDGATRDRIAARVMRGADVARQGIQAGRLDIDEIPGGDYGSIRLTISGGAGIIWESSYLRLRADLTDYNPARLIWWHARRYYTHLLADQGHGDEVAALAESWTIDDGMTLAEANRAASRALYRLSRDLGWRKLTQRERARLRLDGGQWTREEVYSAAQERLRGCADWIGDATDRAAGDRSGQAPMGLVLDEVQVMRWGAA